MPAGAAANVNSFTVKCARPSGVANERSSRGPCGSTNPPGVGDLRVEVVEAGNHPADRVADGAVVTRVGAPVGVGRQRRAAGDGLERLGDPAHDLDLAQQVVGRRLERATRGVHDAHRVLDRHDLSTPSTSWRSVRPFVGRINA